jgi:hypothetical protein
MKYSSSMPKQKLSLFGNGAGYERTRLETMALQPLFDDGDLPKFGMPFWGQIRFGVSQKAPDVGLIKQLPLSGPWIIQDVAHVVQKWAAQIF